MKINKILNNNAVLSIKGNQEIILIGRGIAFQKQTGDDINEAKIDKVFALENEDSLNKFTAIISNMPLEMMEVTEKIVTYAKEKLDNSLNDSVYIHLADHIHFAIKRFKNDQPIRNGLLWEIKQLYKIEYEIGLEALNIICEQFGIILPEDEAGFIAHHIVDAQLNKERPNMTNITKIVQEILTIVKYHFKMEINDDSLAYYRFITHLKFFAQRLMEGKHYPLAVEDSFYTVIKHKYPDSFNCVQTIKKFIESTYNYRMAEDELIYLTIHIERVVKNTNH